MTNQTLQQRIDALQSIVDKASLTYNYDANYEAAKGELLKLKNPEINFNYFRRSVIRGYLATKQQTRVSREYLADLRKSVLLNISSQRSYYKKHGIEV